jgi:signal transduction histidine kinase
MVVVGVSVCLFSLVAFAVLVSRGANSILDLWLLVAVCAWTPGVALSTLINTGSSSVGFAIGHLYTLLGASIVPIVLLVEAGRIFRRLDEAVAVAEERNIELARSREELSQAQRLEVIGQLTGGVAHDFNNLLTVVIGNLELILRAPGDAEKIKRLAQAAMTAAQLGEHLVRQLLSYARRQINRPQIVNVNQLITNVENLMRRVISEQIEVVANLSPVLAAVQIDPAQFETAVLNLFIHARDAMTAGGRITIETRNVVIEPEPSINNAEVPPGRYVMITVSDSGTGMTPVVLGPFDPFFTTKEVGKGSGLGLSQVYGFINTSGGHVKLDSEIGIGTVVTLYLPQSADRPIFPDPKARAAPLLSARDRGTILVVEDDEEVLAVAAECLKELGYRVVTAVNAARALEILAGDQSIDLLFSDVVMPGGINGAQLAAKARRVRPDLKVLLTSGHTAAALNLEYGVPDDLDVVGKPYRREELANKIRQVIGA